MATCENQEVSKTIEYRRGPEFTFTNPNTLLFLTGTALSGKSTIAPIIGAAIDGCSQQPMDLIRLLAQEFEALKRPGRRNPFVQRGSCDSYTLVGDGSYSEESLIQGFNAYAEAVSAPLLKILPQLETQGVKNALFEGVQLTPQLIAPYLKDNSQLIVVTSDEKTLSEHITKRYGDDPTLRARYQTDRLLLLQNEILRQSANLPDNNVIRIENTGDLTTTINQLINALVTKGVIQPSINS